MAYTLTYTSIDATTTKVSGYTGDPVDVVVPETYGGRTVVEIGSGALSSCSTLVSISMPSVITIKNNAFYDCDSLITIDAPLLTVIETGAFASSQNLASVSFNSVTTIGTFAFAGCTSLDSIFFTGNAPAVGANAFAGVTATVYYLNTATGFTNPWNGLVTVAIPAGGAYVGYGAFSGVMTLSSPYHLNGVSGTAPAPTALSNVLTPFTDEMYRKLLLSRIILHRMKSDMGSINRYCKYLFGSDLVRIKDGRNMTITYTFHQSVGAETRALLATEGIVPRPLGVLSIVEYASEKDTIFGFDGQEITTGVTAGNFDRSRFATES